MLASALGPPLAVGKCPASSHPLPTCRSSRPVLLDARPVQPLLSRPCSRPVPYHPTLPEARPPRLSLFLPCSAPPYPSLSTHLRPSRIPSHLTPALPARRSSDPTLFPPRNSTLSPAALPAPSYSPLIKPRPYLLAAHPGPPPTHC